ncbi:GT2D2 protein, partial [Polyodon spathula]|nr:GT2D2 protein [Polyodon spathula]
RKTDNEHQKCNKTWTKIYCFVEDTGLNICLICKGTVAVPKEFKLKRHYDTKHSSFIAYFTAKTFRPFTDGDFMKDCSLVACEILCPAQALNFKQVSLNRMTVWWCVSELRILWHKKLVYFSLAVDETTDCSDTAQMAIFVHGVTNEFESYE